MIKQAKELLNNTLSVKDLDALKTVITYFDTQYYVHSKQEITDFDYDTLFKKLKTLEESNPHLVSPDSPTQRVAFGLSENFETVRHTVPMLSLDNSYNAEDLADFDTSVKKLAEQSEVSYTAEPKFDGASIALIYENDILVRAATRGNGTEGDNITNNAKVIRSIPLKAQFSKYGISKAEVRGEVVIAINAFEKMNENRQKQGLEPFKNPRNTASGGLRMKDNAEVAQRGMEAFIYHLAFAENAQGQNKIPDIKTHYNSIELLNDLGFKVPKAEIKQCNNINEVHQYCQFWENNRSNYQYEIDGVVIKADSYAVQQLAGTTSHHPKWAMAFKFKAQQAVSKLLRVDYQVGRTGAITPVAKIEPVQLMGVTISSISLHNEDFITEKQIHLNDYVLVERAGDVIPYIAGVDVAKRTNEAVKIEFPKECPSCQTPLNKAEGEVAWRCDYAECPAQNEERLIHYVSKQAMDIDGLGKDIIKRFIQEGIIADIESIYNINYDKVLALEGWKEKSVANLKAGIAQSKNQPIWRLIVGLGIRHIGSTTAKMLAKQVPSLLAFKNWSVEQLVELEDVGPKVAESIFDFFNTENNVALLQKLADLGVNIQQTESEQPSSNKLEGLTFLFTGTLTQFTRDEAKAMVEDNGGKNVSSVSKKLNYLIAGEKAGSKLTKAQAIESITILTEDDFLDMLA